jgi:hypothetical protein
MWWEPLTNQPPVWLTNLTATSPNELICADYHGRLVFYNGATWAITEDSGDFEHCSGMWAAANDDVYMVGFLGVSWDKGKIVHFDGHKFKHCDGRYYHIFCDLEEVWAFATDDAYAVGADSGIYHYNGIKWTLTPTMQGNYNAIWANSPSEIFVVTNEGWVGIGNGVDWSWTQLTLNPLWDVAGNASNDVYAVGGPLTEVFHYDGNSWSEMHDLGSTCRSVFCTNGVTFIGTETGDVWRFDAFDYSQRTKYPDILTIGDTGRSIRTIWGPSPDTLYVGGDAPHLVQLDGDTGGIERLITPVGYYIERVTAAYGRSGKDLFITTRNSLNQSQIFRYDGIEMHCDTTHSSVINDIFLLEDCTGFAVGDDSLVLFLWDPEDPVPVFFQQFAAAAYDRGIELVWDVAYDAPIATFQLYRWESTSPEEKILRAEFDPNVRFYKDDDVRPGVVYSYLLLAIDRDGHETWSHEISAQVPVIELALLQNHPNPFNPRTTIRFRIPDRRHVELVIYDVSGRHIRTLLNAPCDPGETSLEWDGRDPYGNPVGSGIYFYQLKAGSKKLSKKMVLLR